MTFWTGNHPLARGEGDLAANPELKRAELAFRQSHPGVSPEALEPIYYREAIGWIASHPVAWMRLVARKAFFSVVPTGPSYAVHSARYRVASVAAVSARSAVRRRRRAAAVAEPAPAGIAARSSAASSILVGLVFFPQERFRMPVIDPVLIVSAAALAGSSSSRPQS